MTGIFLHIVNISITAGWMILAVLLLRLILKNAPKYIRLILWALVGLRLLLPFSLKSNFSLVPSVETIPYDIALQRVPSVNTGLTVTNDLINPVIEKSLSTKGIQSMNPLQFLLPVLSILWILGVVALFLYAFISYLKLKKEIRASILVSENIYICDDIKSPFILGVIRPKIYIPSNLEEKHKSFVLSHERAHIERKDYLWKILGFMLLSIYWFQPLTWVSYLLFCKDMELSCDEKVIKDYSKEEKARYSEALLHLSFPKKRILSCPVFFGESAVKERIKRVLSFKKPHVLIVTVSILVCILTSACFLTDPFNKKISLSKEEILKMDESFIEDLNGTKRKDLRKSYGKPDIVTERNDVWKVDGSERTTYVSAHYDENDKVISMNHSYPMYVYVTESNAGEILGVFSFDGFSDNSNNVFIIPKTDFSGNPIDVNPGDFLYFEYDGHVMESFPMMIDPPYLVINKGKDYVIEEPEELDTASETEEPEELDNFEPTGYPVEEVQRVCVYYQGKVYYDLEYSPNMPEDTIYIGDILGNNDNVLPEKDFYSSHLEEGLKVYISSDEEKLFVRWRDDLYAVLHLEE